MTPQIIIAAVIAVIGFGSGWQIQSWRYGAKEAQYAEQKLAQVQQSAAANIRRLDNVIAAQNAATARSVVIRRDRDRALSELERLRAQLAQPMPGAGDTAAACADRADTASQLLSACAGELQSVAAAADRHANDALMLQQAWPK